MPWRRLAEMKIKKEEKPETLPLRGCAERKGEGRAELHIFPPKWEEGKRGGNGLALTRTKRQLH